MAISALVRLAVVLGASRSSRSRGRIGVHSVATAWRPLWARTSGAASGLAPASGSSDCGLDCPQMVIRAGRQLRHGLAAGRAGACRRARGCGAGDDRAAVAPSVTPARRVRRVRQDHRPQAGPRAAPSGPAPPREERAAPWQSQSARTIATRAGDCRCQGLRCLAVDRGKTYRLPFGSGSASIASRAGTAEVWRRIEARRQQRANNGTPPMPAAPRAGGRRTA